MLIQRLVGPVFLIVVSTVMAAQMKPDFSGEWVLDRPASMLSPGAGGVDSGVVRIEHREPVFRYNVRFMAQGKGGSRSTYPQGARSFDIPMELRDTPFVCLMDRREKWRSSRARST